MTSDQCINCEHYRGSFSCDAYPARIPQKILEGSHDHREPYKGDNGIRFTPLTEKPAAKQ